jgi:beta-galactosidase
VDGHWVVQWKVTSTRQVVCFSKIKLEVHMLSREDAYHHWHLELPSEKFGNYTSRTKQSVIIKGGYLLRAGEIAGQELKLTGDINATTDFELLFDPTERVKFISFNGVSMKSSRGKAAGRPSLNVPFIAPNVSLPDLTAAKWSYLDTLPELAADYDDGLWTNCNLPSFSNTLLAKSLVAGDYGYFAGHLLYRSHFIATGKEDVLYMNATGGGPSI